MIHRIVYAFDPGVTTGYVKAIFKYDDETPEPRGYEVQESFEIEWKERFTTILFGIFDPSSFAPSQTEAIIIEDFQLFPHSARTKIGSYFSEVRLIGVVEACAALRGVHDLIVWQKPIVRKSVRLAGSFSSKHIKDALKHLRYYYIMRSRGKTPRRGVWY